MANILLLQKHEGRYGKSDGVASGIILAPYLLAKHAAEVRERCPRRLEEHEALGGLLLLRHNLLFFRCLRGQFRHQLTPATAAMTNAKPTITKTVTILVTILVKIVVTILLGCLLRIWLGWVSCSLLPT